MRDNLSIAILMILLVLVMVMFPLYNYFERQDDMSYNLVLKATTNFVDEVLNSGYIDQEMYDKLVSQLSNTGNLYDIQMEAHKKLLIEDVDNKGTYVEKSLIDYNEDIFEPISTNSTNINEKSLKNGIYQLDEGDEFYIKVKNSTTTMAGAIFNAIITTSSKDRIVVNYGGIVKNNAWAKVDSTYNAKEYYSDDIYYIESNTGSGIKRMIYFNNVPKKGYGVEIKFKGRYITFDKTSGMSHKVNQGNTESTIEVKEDTLLLIDDTSGSIVITATNQNTKKTVNFKQYTSSYETDRLLADYEYDYIFESPQNELYYWPSMVNASGSVFGSFNIARKTNDVYETDNRLDYNKITDGFTLEALVSINETAKSMNEINCIVGDIYDKDVLTSIYSYTGNNYSLGGIGIRYLPNSIAKKYGVEDSGALQACVIINDEVKSITVGYNVNQNTKVKVSMAVQYNETSDSTTLKLYMDGTKVGEEVFAGRVQVPTATETQAKISIAGSVLIKSEELKQIGGQLDGTVYSAQIYNKALSDEQIRSNYIKTINKYIY